MMTAEKIIGYVERIGFTDAAHRDDAGVNRRRAGFLRHRRGAG
jgi:hypothetical protein